MGLKVSYLFDTNILIYYFNGDLSPEVKEIVTALMKQDFSLSIISKMEFLGFNQFTLEDKQQANIFLSFSKILALEEVVVEQVIQIKQTKKIKLPDAIIAATALHYDMELVTRNTKDFSDIDITVRNPFSL